MDFLDPKKRKSHQIRLYIGYGLMALLVGIVAILMLFQAYGYTFNIQTGDISQNGLLFVNSNPVPTTLTLNGEVKGQTDQRLVLPEGSYSMKLSRDGYRDWNRDVVLDGGTIERFVYPFLFPTELETSIVQLIANKPAFASQSPDRQWLVAQVPGSFTEFDIYNLNQETPLPTRIALPGSILNAEGDVHTYKLIEWSTDNEHLVVQHSFTGGSEVLLINHQEPAESRNLTAEIPTPFTTLKLQDKKFDSYYLYDKTTKILQRYELGTTAPTTLRSNVLAFQPHGDDELVYVTDTDAPDGMVAVNMIDNGTSYTIKILPESDTYLLDVARFNDRWFIAVGATVDEKVYVLRDPVAFLKSEPPKKIVPASVLRLKDAQYMSFSQNARFLAVQAGPKFTVYDAEEDRNYLYDTEISLKKDQKVTWMDGHRLTTISDGKQVVFDYDGTNQQELSDGYADFLPYFNRDYDAVYTFAPSEAVDGRSVLLRTKLIVEE